MRNEVKFGALFFLLRLAGGALLYLIAGQSPEAGHLALLDVPTLVAVFTSGYFFGWPNGVTGGQDLAFHGFGIVVWALLGVVVGVAVSRWAGAAARTE